jgi:hypothetical protein
MLMRLRSLNRSSSIIRCCSFIRLRNYLARAYIFLNSKFLALILVARFNLKENASKKSWTLVVALSWHELKMTVDETARMESLIYWVSLYSGSLEIFRRRALVLSSAFATIHKARLIKCNLFFLLSNSTYPSWRHYLRTLNAAYFFTLNYAARYPITCSRIFKRSCLRVSWCCRLARLCTLRSSSINSLLCYAWVTASSRLKIRKDFRVYLLLLISFFFCYFSKSIYSIRASFYANTSSLVFVNRSIISITVSFGCLRKISYDII